MTAKDHTSDAPPCGSCPWRLDNHGRRHPDGWFTKGNRNRLWTRLRHGASMSCHATDPTNPVSEAAQAAGYRPAPEGAQVLECRGAVVLQQREMALLIEKHGTDVTAYQRDRPRGLTKHGVQVMVARIAFGGVPLMGGPRIGRPDLLAAVGHDPLPWDESCIKYIMQQTEETGT